ncbi:MAG: CpaD family pilus assembly lipoprotein, partial [Beijerinckiaceae bacterium]
MSKSSVKISIALLAATTLAACAREPKHTGSVPDYPAEYRDRHPIVLATAEHGLDIYTVGTSRDLDARQKAELRAFAQDYQKSGRGAVRVLVPRGVNGATNPGIHIVRSVLASAGARSIEQS